jgi:nicotinamide-nucleotide adenylyltransferase
MSPGVEPPPNLPARFGRIGTIARWKPVHLGHAAVLQSLAERAEEVLIGVGSTNRYDLRNPFGPEESEEMIRRAMGDRRGYRLVRVPDLGQGPRWRSMVETLFGPLELFVTANAYVRDLLRNVYPIAHPVWLIPPERRVALNATMVRQEMARGDAWRDLVPPAVASYLESAGLVERLRREFGPETLAGHTPPPVN